MRHSSTVKFHGMAANYFHVIHLSDKFLVYAVPIDVWSLSFWISRPPAGRLSVDIVIKGRTT